MKVQVMICDHTEVFEGVRSEEEGMNKFAEKLLSMNKGELIDYLCFLAWEIN